MAQDEPQDELFAFPPRTPERLVRAAILANQLDRPLLARQYLSSFLDTQPGKATLQALRKEIGISVFLKLSSTQRLQPEATNVLKLINDANPYPQLTPSGIDDLVQSLGQSKAETTKASLQLIAASADAVIPLLDTDLDSPAGVIADKLLSRYTRRFQAGLVSALPVVGSNQQVRVLNYLAKTADPDISVHILPLQYSPDPEVKAATSRTLARLKANDWVGLSKPAAAKVLAAESAASLKAASLSQTRPKLAVMLDQNEAKPDAGESTPGPDGIQQLETALSLATQAVALDDSVQAQAAKYAAEAAANAWPPQWQDPSLNPPPITLDMTIATAAIEIALEAECTASLLEMLQNLNVTSQIFEAAPVVKRKCLTNKDPRVRLLAAAATWLNGERSDRVVSGIQSVIDGSRRPEAVVIDPRVGDGSVAAGVLRTLGYSVDFERSGREGFSKAAGQLNCEMIFIHSNCLQWPLSITLANLRADYRTSNVSIVIYGPEEHRSNVASRVDTDSMTWFEREPLSDRLTAESMQLQQVLGPLLTKEERTSMIKFALRLTNDQ